MYKRKRLNKDKMFKCFHCHEKGHWSSECPLAPESTLIYGSDGEVVYTRPLFDCKFEDDAIDERLKRIRLTCPNLIEVIKIILRGESVLLSCRDDIFFDALSIASPILKKTCTSNSIVVFICHSVAYIDSIESLYSKKFHIVCMHGQTDISKRNSILSDLDKADILFTTPEYLLGIARQRFLRKFSAFWLIPAISLAVICDAQNISPLSKDYRPSYLSSWKSLLQIYLSRCVIGITNSFTTRLLDDISASIQSNIKILDLMKLDQMRTNIFLKISRITNDYKPLIELLRSSVEKYVIVQCSKRENVTTLISEFKYNGIQNATQLHSGLSVNERRLILQQYQSGQTKLLISTVLPHNLSITDLLIIYGNPMDLELLMKCIVNMNRATLSCVYIFCYDQMLHVNEAKRFIYNHYIDFYPVTKLATTICNNIKTVTENHCYQTKLISIPVDMAQSLFVKSQDLQVLIQNMERCNIPGVHLEFFPTVQHTCLLYIYKSTKKILGLLSDKFEKQLLQTVFEVGDYIEKTKKRIVFKLVEFCNENGLEIFDFLSKMKDIETKLNAESIHQPIIMVQFKGECIPILIRLEKPMNDGIKDSIVDRLWKLYLDALRYSVNTYDMISSLLLRYSGNDRVNVDFWIELDKLIKGKTVSICGDLIQIPNQEDLSYASRIITDFIHDHGIGFTALSVCKILYGIDSYEHPKVIWQTIKKYWNSMKSIPFDQLLSLADNKLQATRKIRCQINCSAARSIALLPDQLLCCQINCSAARSIALLPDQLLCCQINCSAARSIALLPDQLLCCQINCSAARSIALLPDQLLCCQINCSAARSIVLHHP
ncbi:hypothetical protein GJ496_003155 [Pomphorhynchus laevis]|nr:hypothetical protein GJ496_003155 [Pomphorhynchus laevis]